MKFHSHKIAKDRDQPAAAALSHMQHKRLPISKFSDNRPEAILQRRLQSLANANPQRKQIPQLSNSPQPGKYDNQAFVEVKNNPITVAIVQKVKIEALSTAEETVVHTIARQMGVDVRKLTFKKWSEENSHCDGNTIYLSSDVLLKSELDNPRKLRFVLGHELSHYITRDNEILGLSTLLTGGLGALVQYVDLGWFGGTLGTLGVLGGSLLSGGGPVNALIHALSAGSTIILVKLLTAIGYGYIATPLAAFLAIAGINTAIKILSKLVKDENKKMLTALSIFFGPEMFAQLIIEAKADIHSVLKLGAARGGIAHFDEAMKENTTGMPLKTEGNAIYDPSHPPLSLRIRYLKKIAGIP